MRNKKLLNGKWELCFTDDAAHNFKESEWIDAKVPRDVHHALSDAGIIAKDLYYRKNLEEAGWVTWKYWWFRKTFTFDEVSKDIVRLVFDGLDTFAVVYLNGQKLGETENMHLQYKYDVKKLLKKGSNEILVGIEPIWKRVDELHKKYPEYNTLFYPGRNLVRKTQCQFGWDWAPDSPSLGIWKDVYIENLDNRTIEDVYVETKMNGDICFRIRLLSAVTNKTLEVTVKDENKRYKETVEANGYNNFINLKIESPRLWWPVQFGEPNMYEFEIKLKEKNKILDKYRGSFGIRETKVVEHIIEKDRIGFTLYINERPVFCKGANWVPVDNFPGGVDEERYTYLVTRAREANFNMLRIWGGGIYEKEKFYEECDRQGIMVWQDYMTACAEYPDDRDWFLKNMISEAEYQTKRLRKHPSVVVWCGGNESSSSHSYNEDRPGRWLVHYYLRGVASSLHSNTAYIPCSPHSKSDFGQIQTSGETHWSTWPREISDRFSDFRERMKNIRTVFNSEVCLQGPSPLESMLNFVTYEDIWPPSDVIDYHVMYHPVLPDVHPRYVMSQLKMAEQIIGSCNSAEEFISNAMMANAEMVNEELGFYRSLKFDNSGALTWMYNECWPCSNWALLDYYGYTKASYYAAKRMFAPLAICIKRVYDDYTVHLMNDTLSNAKGHVDLSYMDIDGNVFWSKGVKGSCEANSCVKLLSLKPEKVNRKNSFLLGIWKVNGQELAAIYFPHLWKDIPFEKPEIEFSFVGKNGRENGKYLSYLKIKSKNYSRFLYIAIPDMDVKEITLSDNYFDMAPGQVRTIALKTSSKITDLTIKSLYEQSGAGLKDAGCRA